MKEEAGRDAGGEKREEGWAADGERHMAKGE